MAHTTATPSRVPVLGALSLVARIAVLVTLALAIVAIVIDFGLHVEGSVVFIVSALAILGLAWIVGLSTERLGALTGPQVGGILNATFGNIA
jgi:Ca2+:H+ antiporter